jgi:cathepsin L
MKAVFATMIATAMGATYTEDQYQTHFAKWMTEHNKQYDAEEFFSRFEVFKMNLEFIAEHNARFHKGLETYSVALNQLADMDRGEYRRTMLGYSNEKPAHIKKLNKFYDPLTSVSGSLNWTALGAVTPVKNQGQCGSCWAFSTTGSMEGAIQIAGKGLTSLSEQQLVDCALAYGNFGCNGGLMDNAFQYAEKNGLCSEAAYPYNAVKGSCKASSCTAQPGTKLSGYTDVSGGENGFTSSNIGSQPVSIAIEADQAGFQFYSGGVFSGNCGQNLDHGVLLTGYGNATNADGSSTPYWIVKNSWGTSWGEAGYIRLIMGDNECGLGDQPSFPSAGSN